jgi:hypothetical protein
MAAVILVWTGSKRSTSCPLVCCESAWCSADCKTVRDRRFAIAEACQLHRTREIREDKTMRVDLTEARRLVGQARLPVVEPMQGEPGLALLKEAADLLDNRVEINRRAARPEKAA